MSDKYILFDLGDENSKKLGDVISNSTCKKIVALLAENEASESDIASSLRMPVNTVEYNLKKLLDSGIIEKSSFLWSQKGKKIPSYKIANKLIVIAPKKTLASKLKSFIPIVLITGIITAFLTFYDKIRYSNIIESTSDKILAASPSIISGNENSLQSSTALISASGNPAIWFAIGAIVVILAFLFWNWKKL